MPTVEERARIVIGADGVHPLMAKAVRAPEYHGEPPLTTNYYSYYSLFPAEDLEFYVRDYHAVGCFPTHDGLTLIAVLWPASRFEEIRADIEGSCHEDREVGAWRGGPAHESTKGDKMVRHSRLAQLLP